MYTEALTDDPEALSYAKMVILQPIKQFFKTTISQITKKKKTTQIQKRSSFHLPLVTPSSNFSLFKENLHRQGKYLNKYNFLYKVGVLRFHFLVKYPVALRKCQYLALTYEYDIMQIKTSK